MTIRFTLLAAACALALVACANKPSSTAETAPTPAANSTAAAPTTESAPDANVAPVETAAPAATTPLPTPTPAVPAPTPAPSVAGAACSTEVAATDAMQFNVKSITVPASCTTFKITLKHAGKMPMVAMGHNIVITKLADMQAVTADGMAAGAKNDYVKPADPRVIAHTRLIGGGETASVSFPVSRIQGDGPYEFFCSFPGHSTLMKGTIAVK